MDKAKSYKTAGAFCAALETRLQTRAREQGTDLQRLRRQVAFDRFLARMFSKGPISPVSFQRLPHVLFELAIRLPHGRVHGHAQIGFLVWREFAGYVFEEHEGAQLHEEFAKQQWRRSRLAPDRAWRFRLGAGIIGGFDLGNGFEHSVILNERTASHRAPFVAMLLHPSRFETEERVKQIVRIPAEECASQPNDPVGA